MNTTKTAKIPKTWVFLDVSANCECDTEEYSVARVNITPQYAKELLKKIELVRKIRKSDDQLWEMYYWDDSASYFEEKNELNSSPTECDQLIVRADEVQWCAYIKHSENVEVRTDKVTYDFLKARAGK